MHARETEFGELDEGTKASFLRDSTLGALWRVGVAICLVAAAHYATQLVTDLMFTW